MQARCAGLLVALCGIVLLTACGSSSQGVFSKRVEDQGAGSSSSSAGTKPTVIGQAAQVQPTVAKPSGSASSSSTPTDLCAAFIPNSLRWAYNMHAGDPRNNLCYAWVDPIPFGATCGAPPARSGD